MLVVAAVSDQARTAAPELAARLRGRELRVDPLDAGTARQLLADWVGLDPELVAHLGERCEGDLGLALEIVREGVRTGRLAQGLRGLEAVDDAILPLPDAVVEAWRPALPPPGPIWPALERAAVYGTVVDRERLARAVGDPERCAEVERVVLETGLGVPRPEGWRWASPALRACILTDAGERLAEHHLACAAVTDDAWARGEHRLEAGRLEEALPDLLDASVEVIRRGGMAVAARRLRQLQTAMELAGLPELHVAWAHLWSCWATLGPTHLGYDTCRAYNERLVVLARRFPDDPHLQDLRTGSVGGLAWLANVQLLPKVARPWLDEMDDILRKQGRRLAHHHDRMGWYALTIGDADLAVRSFTEAVEVATAKGARSTRFVADSALGVAKRHRGDPDAVEHLERAGAAMLEAGILSARADLAAALGDAERQRGNLARAEAHFQEALRATAEGEARADPGFRIGYALVLRDLGRLDRAWTELDTARRTLTDEGPTWTALIDLHLAAVAAQRGDAQGYDRVPAAVSALFETGFVDPDLADAAERLAAQAQERGLAEVAARAGELATAQRRALAPRR